MGLNRKDFLNNMKSCRLSTMTHFHGYLVPPLVPGPQLGMDVTWLPTATMDPTGLDMMMWSPWPSRLSGSTPWIWEAPWSGALRLMTLGETMGKFPLVASIKRVMN